MDKLKNTNLVEQELEALLNAIPNPVAAIDNNLDILTYNKDYINAFKTSQINKKVFLDQFIQKNEAILKLCLKELKKETLSYPIKNELYKVKVSIFNTIIFPDNIIILVFDKLSQKLPNYFELIRKNPAYQLLASYKDGIIHEISDTFLNFIGYQRDELVGIKSLNTGILKKEFNRDVFVKKILNNEEYILNIKNKSGGFYDFKIKGKKIEIEKIEYLLYSMEDVTKQKKIEKELIISEKRYKELFTHMINGFVILKTQKDNPDDFSKFQIIKYNIAFKQLFKIPSKSDINIDNNPKIYYFLKNVGDILSKKRINDFEYYDQNINKHLRISIYYPGPRIIALLIQDQTENILVRNRLSEANEKLSKFINNSTDGIVIINEQGDILVWNPGIEKITNLNSKNVLNEKIWNIYHKISQTNNLVKKQDSDAKNFFYQMMFINSQEYFHKLNQFEITSLSGIKKTLQYVIFPVYTNNQVLIGGIFRDITEMNRAMKTLTKSEFYLKKIQDLAKLGNWEINFTENTMYWSDQVYHELDIPLGHGALSIKQFYKYIHPNDKTRVFEEYKKMLRNKTHKLNLSTRIISYKNKEKFLYLEIENSYTNNGKLQYSFGFIQNKTNEELIMRKLRKSENELLESIKTKDKFFNIIAHDLRNPFNHILGFLELLTENFSTFSREKIESILQILKTSSENTYNLLENLLNWSRTQTGKIEYNPEKLSIKELLQEKEKVFRPQAEQKGINLFTSIQKVSSKYIYADENLLNTIFRNLISNAIKFTENNGTISILATSDDNYKNQILFSVIDSGIGISEEKINTIFNEDEIISSKGTKGEKGTGLGLMLCKEFVEINKGAIWIESIKNSGTTINFTVPIYIEL